MAKINGWPFENQICFTNMRNEWYLFISGDIQTPTLIYALNTRISMYRISQITEWCSKCPYTGLVFRYHFINRPVCGRLVSCDWSDPVNQTFLLKRRLVIGVWLYLSFVIIPNTRMWVHGRRDLTWL